MNKNHDTNKNEAADENNKDIDEKQLQKYDKFENFNNNNNL